jgi:putative ATPase
MTEISAIRADITTLEVDAIVNAANTHLQHGGGVAQAIVMAGGSIIQTASDDWIREHGPLEPDTAAVTPAGDMPPHHVIHVAGPRFREGLDNAGLLRRAVVAALDTAESLGCRSIAIPAISAGIYGYPLIEATQVYLVGFNDRVTKAFDTALAGVT